MYDEFFSKAHELSRQGVPFIWPVRLPGPDGKLDPWNTSALEAVGLAQKQWVRVSANKSLGAYDVHVATGTLPEPVVRVVARAMAKKPGERHQSAAEIVADIDRALNALGHDGFRRWLP